MFVPRMLRPLVDVAILGTAGARLARWRADRREYPEPSRQALPVALPAPPAEAAPPGMVEARLLGRFELRIAGRVVEQWGGRRGVEVLRYLFAGPRHARSRDEVLEEFWPGVAPAAARNRLQVAVSGLRRVLAEITPLPVVEFADGDYRINPALRVEVDVERFERAIGAARRAERAGEEAAALAAYRDAVQTYRGDFAADSPYGHWTLLPRETMRLAYLDALDRVSRILLRTGRIDDTIATALRMLDVDPCREDAHRLLMRCYAHQGRAYQAMRQYEFCRRIMAVTLGVDPELRTTRLYREIRAGSAREPALTE